MPFDLEQTKVALDIGLGAVSLLLWMRQGKVNTNQLKANQDLATMVRDHDVRLGRLETVKRLPKRKR